MWLLSRFRRIEEKINIRFAIDVDIFNLPEGIDQKISALYGLTLKEEKQKVKKKSTKISKKKKEEETND